jgi:hypothetical protein
MNTVQIHIRSVYGSDKAYPGNDTARQFAELIGVRTFSAAQLRRIEALGYAIERVATPSQVFAY